MTLALLLFAPSLATANDVTDMPPALRGDVEIGYAGEMLFGGMVEDGEEVGRRRISHHQMRYGVEFAPIDGVAIGLEIPHTVQLRYIYPDPPRMTYDPVSESGTLRSGAGLGDELVIGGSGVEGLWLDVALAPFAERYERGHQVTWRLDLGYRVRLGKSFWEESGGKRGPTKGGGAFKIEGAFSADNGVSSPYMKTSWILETPRTVSVTTSDGVSEVRVAPGHAFDVVAGFEVPVATNVDDGLRIAIDLHAGFGYRSWEDVPSGVYLPSVLPQSQEIPVTSSDHLSTRAGLELDFGINHYVQFRIGSDVVYRTPYILEHPYPVRTSTDTVQVDVYAALTGKFRTPGKKALPSQNEKAEE